MPGFEREKTGVDVLGKGLLGKAFGRLLVVLTHLRAGLELGSVSPIIEADHLLFVVNVEVDPRDGGGKHGVAGSAHEGTKLTDPPDQHALQGSPFL